VAGTNELGVSELVIAAFDTMEAREHILLRIYLQSADRAPSIPTHQRIIKAARAYHLAGVTVLRGIMGVGYHGILKPSAWSLARHEPIVLEIVDSPEKIAAFVRGPLDEIMAGGMLTLERAAVIMYRHRDDRSAAALHLAGAKEPLSTLPDIQPGPHMTLNENGVLVRVFIGESDRFQNQPLHEAIVLKVRELGLAGATVLRGTDGFGARSVVHKAALLEMSSDMPIVIEIVDTREKIDLLLPHLESMVNEGMITMEYVAIVMYRHGDGKDKGAGEMERSG
jgi:PII-like signaling protein